MVSLKKTALAVIALGVSGVASAAMYTPAPAPMPACSAENVTVPCAQNAWDLGIQALYIQANNVESVSQTATIDDADNVFTGNNQDYQPSWVWGFRLEGSYHFGTGNDVNLNWTHFNKDSNNQVTNGLVVPSYLNNPAFGASYDDGVVTSFDNKFNEVNLEFGQKVNFGEHVNARFHAGLSYVRIEQDIDQTGTDQDLDNDPVFIDESDNISTTSKFNGWGPRGGVDLAYDCGNGFAIVSNMAAALYVGNRDFNSTENNTSFDEDGAISGTSQVNNDSSSRIIVPAAEAKLGLQYGHPTSHGDCILQAGYQINNYWDSVQRSNNNSLADQDTNFAFQGVYFGLKWVGNA